MAGLLYDERSRLRNKNHLKDLFKEFRLTAKQLVSFHQELLHTQEKIIALEKNMASWLKRYKRVVPPVLTENFCTRLMSFSKWRSLLESDKRNFCKMLDALKRIQLEYELDMKHIKIMLQKAIHAKSKIDRAKENMAHANLRLVFSIAKKYLNRGLDFVDLLQEGNMGLMTAIDKFDVDEGCKVTTYAYPWVQQAIMRAIADSASVIRLPVHANDLYNKIRRISGLLHQRYGRTPTPLEISKEIGKPLEKVVHILKIDKDPLSMQQTIGHDDNSACIGDIVKSTNPSPQDVAIHEDLKTFLKKAFE